MLLKTIANIGKYKKERVGIVMSPDPKPKKPLINPEKEIIINSKIKFSEIK
tara:strand:- start:181 stop:333 length:153 start_codon:yes stop_codon:yes gene_type:complete